jgi:hypothetical protein
MAINLQIYESQVLQFIQSLTIIFSPMAQQINLTVQASGIAVDLTAPLTWKYYLNLSGHYFQTDTPMTITSLDTQQTVTFTTAMLATNPRTQAAYTIGSPLYSALVATYPHQVDLIKSILYPVDIGAAIAAPDFTILGFGSGYLEANEQEAILFELNQVVSYIGNRWYFSWLSYEAYATWAFWAILWQSLPNAIFAARLKYLKTAAVNSFHIWNYLESRGIADFSDILTAEQALFLYRNIDYLMENKGKQSTLVILVNNLLDSLNVGLVGKTIFMNTAINAATCQWTPEFVATVVPTDNAQSLTIIPPETMAELNAELITAGFEVNTSPAFIVEEQTLIGNTILNTLPTKLVEIQLLGVDQKYGAVLNTFIVDTLVSMITTGRYAPTLEITDPTTSLSFSLGGADALALYYYVIQRSELQNPTHLPTIYSPSCAFRYDVTAASFPTQFTIPGSAPSQNVNIAAAITNYLTVGYAQTPSNANAAALIDFELPGIPAATYPTQSYLSVTKMMAGITYPMQLINDPTVFSTLVADLFQVLINHIRFSRLQGGMVANTMFITYMENFVLQTTPYPITLSPAPDYATWASTLGLTDLLAKLNAQSDFTDAFSALATAITTAFVPENSAVFSFFSYTDQTSTTFYDRLKSLFVQLCSYNIAFLDTDRVNTWWALTTPIVASMQAITRTRTIPSNPFMTIAVTTETTSGATR